MRVGREIEKIELDLLRDSDADHDALKERRRRLARDRWHISKRISDFPNERKQRRALMPSSPG